MGVHLTGSSGLLTLIALLAAPGLVAAYFLHSLMWVAIVPGVLTLIMLLLAALPIKKKITPQQFAEELETHLLGTDGQWGWDDITSVRLADERLEEVRVRLAKFDILESEELREELRQVIAALRRGEIPDIIDDHYSSRIPRFHSS